MERSTIEQQQILAAVSTLPEEALVELASFLDYLRHKSAQRREVTNNSASFLVAVAGLGNSGQQDVLERDKEILCNEIAPVYGWSSKTSKSMKRTVERSWGDAELILVVMDLTQHLSVSLQFSK